jgi:hypothetical protein
MAGGLVLGPPANGVSARLILLNNSAYPAGLALQSGFKSFMIPGLGATTRDGGAFLIRLIPTKKRPSKPGGY